MGRVTRGAFSIYWAFTTILAICIGAIWYVSPLGLGFRPWPAEEPLRSMAFGLYEVTYFIGIPTLLLSQALSLFLAWRSWRKLAFVVPALALTLVVAGIAIVTGLAG